MSLDMHKSTILLPSLLICDSQYMTRSTFALLARELGCGEVVETSEIKTAQIKCEGNSFNLIILDIEEPEAMSLIRMIRDNLLLPKMDVPIIVMLKDVNLKKIQELKSLNISEILVKPTRMKSIYDAFSRCL